MEVLAPVSFEGRKTTFNLNNPNDHIQAFHRRGHFYEARQLLFHRDLIPMKSTVIDIGANVGNHTLFYATHTFASQVYPFEPNPVAAHLLRLNIASNRDVRATIHEEKIHHAIGGRAAILQVVMPAANNLGAAQLAPLRSETAEGIECVRLDDLRFEGQVAFVKIDVEGMELDVLAGAETLIDSARPAIAIEVSDKNDAGFWAWSRGKEYQVIHVFHEYLHFKNYIAVPTRS